MISFGPLVVLSLLVGVGVSGDRHGQRVTDAEVGVLTHVVFINSRLTQCSGSLISRDVVLTSAHCVLTGDTTRVSHSDVKITAGTVDMIKSNPAYTQERRGSEIIVHPDFRYGRLSGHDLALIRVHNPFNLSDTVFPVELNGAGWPQKGNRTQDCQTSGFGAVQDHSSIHLRIMEVWAKHGEQSCPCTKRFQWKRLVCALPDDDLPQPCRGDAGAALICHDKIVAVTHMVRERRTCDFLRYPDCDLILPSLTMFMFLCPYNDWISEYVPSVPPTPPSCSASTLIVNTLLPYFVLDTLNTL